tara:strand:- start:1432 stop:1932 length:501 start_codon:yes stop_codon:yes gene_type:complete
MSHRRKSACCCDGKQGPCFLGYGTVPKTDYMRRYIPGVRNLCAEGSDIESGFPEKPECQKNYHDNWAFCDPTKEEELVLFIERPQYNFSTSCTAFTPSPCVECDPPPNAPMWDRASKKKTMIREAARVGVQVMDLGRTTAVILRRTVAPVRFHVRKGVISNPLQYQ